MQLLVRSLVYIHRCASVMVTTQAMTAVDVNLVIMDLTVANHKFSLDSQLLLTVMQNGRSLLGFFGCYLHMTLAM